MKFDLKSLLIVASIGASAIESASIRRSNEVAQNSPLNIVRRTPGNSYGETGFDSNSKDYGNGHGDYGSKGHLKDKTLQKKEAARQRKEDRKKQLDEKRQRIKDRHNEKKQNKKNKYGKPGKGGYNNDGYNPPKDNYGSVDPIKEHKTPKDDYESVDPIEEYNPPKDNGYTSYNS